MKDQIQFNLSESDIPKRWYNIAADSGMKPTAVLNPITLQMVTPEFLGVLFPKVLIEQEISTDRYIEIPEEVRDMYKMYRPTPLIRATRLEKMLDTPAHIYFKYEGVSPSGSHKMNTAIAQAYYNKISGTKAMTTETGAGQWGSALSIACNYMEMDIEVYMVRVSYDLKPYRRLLMQMNGGQVYPSPSNRTDAGRAVLAASPDSPGSLGIAISEAVEVAVKSNGAKKYGLGSVLNHVILHQSVIGEEAIKQMDMADEYPDVVIGCVGGGSNFAGIAYPFLRENLIHGRQTKFLAVEPTATPSITRGMYAFDYCDTAKTVPIVKMYTLGSDFIPAPIHAGGLRYHGMAPSLSAFCDAGLIDAVAVHQKPVFEAANLFVKTQGILPAPESAHAIRVAIDQALDAKEKGEKRVILFNLSGHGHFDLSSYESYLSGELENYDYPQEAIASISERLPSVGF